MIIAVDTGGTKTLITSFDESGKHGDFYRFETPKNKEEYLEKVTKTIITHYETAQIDGIIVAVPGIVRNNIAMWCANLQWRNFDIANSLKKDFSCPIFIENDANLAGLAETKKIGRAHV